MDDPSGEWEIEEDSPSAWCSSKASWYFDKGLWLGKKVAITGFVISSVPLVLPPLVVVSALGVAVSIPFWVFMASYACAEKFMSKLLPMPSPCLNFECGTVFGEETEAVFEGGLSVQEGTKEHVEDVSSWSGTREELLEEGDDEFRPQCVETDDQEPVEEAARNTGERDREEFFCEHLSAPRDDFCGGHTDTELEEPMNDAYALVMEEEYKEDVGEDLNASSGDYGNGHTQTEYNDEEPSKDANVVEEGHEGGVVKDLSVLSDDYLSAHSHSETNDEEPMNGIDAKVKEDGRGKDVENLSASRDDYGCGRTRTAFNDEDPMNYIDVKVKEDGYEEDVGEDLNASRDDYGSLHALTEHNDEEPMNDEHAKVNEEGYEEDDGEYLEGEDEEPLEGFDVETEEVPEEEIEVTEPLIERSKYGQAEDYVHQVLGERDEKNVANDFEENILAGGIMGLVENLGKEGDVSTPIKEADWEEKEQHEIADERGERNLASIEENRKPMDDVEEPVTGGIEVVEMNDIDTKVEEEEYKERVDGHSGENERPLQGFHVEIEEVGKEDEKETSVVIERIKRDQKLGDGHQADAMVARNDKSNTNYIEEENLAGETTRLNRELKDEGNVSNPVEETDRRNKEKYEVSKDRDENNNFNFEEKERLAEDPWVETVKLLRFKERAGSELIHDEMKENKETQRTGEDHLDDVMAEAERVMATARILQVNKDESNINNTLVVVEKQRSDGSGSHDGTGVQGVNGVAEQKKAYGVAQNGVPLERKKEDMVFSDADAREMADESGFDLFGDKERAGEKYPHSAHENPAGDNQCSSISV